MIYKALALATLGVTLQANAAQTYVIDSLNSFVEVPVPVWVNTGPASSSGPEQLYDWMLEVRNTRFSISGSFTTDRVESPFNPGVFRLQIAPVSFETTAPTYSQFSFPSELMFGYGNSLYMDEAASVCNYDEFFGKNPPIYSCSVMILGATRQDHAELLANSILLSGWVSSPNLFIGWAQSPTMPPDITDYSDIAGLFSYSIQANAVPEPGTAFLLLGALGIAGHFRRRTALAA